MDDKLTLAIQSSISSVNDKVAPISSTAGFNGDIIGSAYLANPTWPNDDTFDAGGGSLNPANLLTNYQSESNSTRLLLNASLDYQFSNDFSTKVNLGIDNFEGTSTSVFGSGVNGINRVSGNGQGAYNQLESKSNLLEWTVNYKKGFGNVKLDAVAGYSFQDFRTFGFNSQGWGFGSSTLDQISSNLAAARDQWQVLLLEVIKVLDISMEGHSLQDFFLPSTTAKVYPSMEALESIHFGVTHMT